jgi:hypothetical protein
MDLARKFNYLRPSATFENNQVNYYSLDTIKETYIGDDCPTQAQIDAVQESDMASYELDIEANAIIESNKFRKLQFEIFFDLENRQRIQEGLSEITRSQYNLALVAKYKTL